MKLIDTHCHLTFEQLAGDVEGVLQRSAEAGISQWITVGTDADESRKAVALAGKFEGLYAGVGVHPHQAKEFTPETIEKLKQLAQDDNAVAIGETGLDFHYNFSKQDTQREVFAKHLRLADELDKPVIVHSREAFGETIEILDRFGKGVEKVVFHCFSGTAEQARVLLERGYFISFTGVVTFKNAESIRDAVKVVPVERMMLETDCPYMSPEPMRRQKVNEPALLVHTARLLAAIKGVSLEEFADSVKAVSENFFGLA